MGRFSRVPKLQKLADLLSVDRFGMLHVNLHSAATRPPLPSHFQDHPVLESSQASGSSCIGQFLAVEERKGVISSGIPMSHIAFAFITTTAQSNSTPLNGSSLAVLGGIIGAMRRRYAIGGWLFFFMWGVFVGLGMTILQIAGDWHSYVPSGWHSSKLYLIFLMSFAPRFMALVVMAITCFMLLRTFDWRLGTYLRITVWVYLSCGLISIVLDYIFFPTDAGIAWASLFLPAILLFYIHRSSRFRMVFQTQDWMPATKFR